MNSRAAAFVWMAPLVVLCSLAIPRVDRPGYSPDEEITAVTVDAIAQSGLPLLPSGILYNRGFPYPYLAWLAGEFFGRSLLSYRIASLLCALLALAVAYRLGVKLGGRGVALTASVFLAAFPAYIAASVFARQYSALALCALLFVLLFWEWTSAQRRGWLVLLVLGCAVLLHPAGTLLAALPAIHFAAGERSRPAAHMAAAALATTVLLTFASYGLHFLSLRHTGMSFSRSTAIYAMPTPALPTMFVTELAGGAAWAGAMCLFGLLAFLLYRFLYGHPVVLFMAAAGLVFQPGLVILFGTGAILLQPRETRRTLMCAVVIIVSASLWWTVLAAAVTDAQYSLAFASSLVRAAFAYPYASVLYTISVLPQLWWLSAAATVIAIVRCDDPDAGRVRSLAALALIVLVAFSVLAVPMTERYLLLPWTLLTVLAAVGAVGLGRSMARLVGHLGPPQAAWAGRVVVLMLCAWQFSGLYRYGHVRAADSMPTMSRATSLTSPITGASWNPEQLRSLIEPTDTVICTEEVACLYLLGRVDYLLALPPADSAHYVSWRGGAPLGFYAGAPALTTDQQLRELVQQPRHACTVFVTLNTGKVGFDYYSTLAEEAIAGRNAEVLVSGQEAFVTRNCAGESRRSL